MESTAKNGNRKSKSSMIPLSSPIKPLSSAAAATSSDQIATPEKPPQLHRRTRNRSVAFSLKEVKQIAQGLQKTNNRPSDLARSDDDDLSSLDPSVSKPSRTRTPIKLPEKYEILAVFFDFMVSSTRLLRLKRSRSTFSNIRAQVENLTERRFTYGHLAQMMYILPGVIVIKKDCVLDEKTSCVRPELLVTLNIDGVVDEYSALSRLFRDELVNFSKEHQEGVDIPEEQLPHPFNQTKPTATLNNSMGSSSHPPIISSSSQTFSQKEFAPPSHMSLSFRKSFSQKTTFSNKSPPNDNFTASFSPSPTKQVPVRTIVRRSLLGCPIILPSLKAIEIPEEEAQEPANLCSSSEKEVRSLEATPAKVVHTPARLATMTPDIQTPKRSRASMEADTLSAKKSARTKLFTTPKKNLTEEEEENEAGSSSQDDDLKFLPPGLLQNLKEKERKAFMEKDPRVIEANRRRKLIARLPSTFDTLLLIFQSRSRPTLTKQELMHKIITNNVNIVDRGEAEEQLKLLLELIPDWISERMASTGDILYRVDKISNPEELRLRLLKAE